MSTESDPANSDQHKNSQPGLVNGTIQEPLGQASTSNQQPGENVKNYDSHKDVRTQIHKDHHPQSQGQTGSNHRSNERGRGSGRGRGGFSLNNTNGMSHYGQPAYGTQHHTYPFPPSNSRHPNPYGAGYPSMSYQFSAQPGPSQRKPTNGNRRQGGGRAPPMASMNVPQYDPNTYHMPTVGMLPYGGGGNSITALAQQQVEYYFSVDNIVKDIFLRKHMDSQGFVALGVIHGFSRMQNISPDIEVLRHACIESLSLELAMGSDGIERVRKKTDWEKWVFQDMSERHPSARHDGPSQWQPSFMGGYQHPMMSPQYPAEAGPMFSPTHEQSFAQYPNGNYGLPMNMSVLNGSHGTIRPQESQLSAAVPEFSPSAIPAMNGLKSAPANGVEEHVNGVSPSVEHPHSMTNGTVLGQPQAFVEDSQIPNGVGHTQ
ncbi:hypothetical protein NPX13_g10680 [Xylaria arbuscula]|uniref:HTH La-type RNA-binding domain-containing protein n=1 Tax=Xylaria arbuscula TaxID=114810 RepID=A0A9W8N4K3_9PEZI|nr:hypothetical protein NPX13_g10680 [Xylaria arbuscula]